MRCPRDIIAPERQEIFEGSIGTSVYENNRFS